MQRRLPTPRGAAGSTPLTVTHLRFTLPREQRLSKLGTSHIRGAHAVAVPPPPPPRTGSFSLRRSPFGVALAHMSKKTGLGLACCNQAAVIYTDGRLTDQPWRFIEEKERRKGL
ncbi:hypothetical protein NDU88_000922 [Pleurodeles waltl]|uniref:Uncharacterized protein n=1 Tax=Pleurodeles waltl TaxID=8319 RepID=A0AAV7UTB1_PLEWA|nr:hypothetical protein NDU88_000922 [Pleurodeles waltl]